MNKFIFIGLVFFSKLILANNDSEPHLRKNHIEDIFIWKISDELKLSVQQEKKFSDINKRLNKKKADLNKKIQESIQNLNENSPEINLTEHRKLLSEYNQISIREFDEIKSLLGAKKFAMYLKIKNELTSKVKSILIGEKGEERKNEKKLPPPRVIIEKNE